MGPIIERLAKVAKLIFGLLIIFGFLGGVIWALSDLDAGAIGAGLRGLLIGIARHPFK